jgi:hypothetical protein
VSSIVILKKMVKQNKSASKSTSKKRLSCPRMRAINTPRVVRRVTKTTTHEKSKKTIKPRKRATKTTTEKKIQNPDPTREPRKKFTFCIMRAENDYTLLQELEEKKELENRAKAKTTTLVCSECKTRSTPLWRKGSKGPKVIS